MYGHLFILGIFDCKPKTGCLGSSYLKQKESFLEKYQEYSKSLHRLEKQGFYELEPR